jgi:glycosyltransferase
MKLSIITISLNPGASLERTINSICSQVYADIEWIIVDGGSTDGTLEVYESIRSSLTKFVSEPDRGIADAMNKGLRMAGGDAVLYMNAGDEFANIEAVKNIIANWDFDSYDWATGGGFFHNEDGVLLYERSVENETGESLVAGGCRILHSATIIKRNVLIGAGGFSDEFRSSMDYELWLRLICNNILPQILPFPIARFYLGGLSGDLLKRYREDLKARRLHGVSKVSLELKFALIALLKKILKPIGYLRIIYFLKERFRV